MAIRAWGTHTFGSIGIALLAVLGGVLAGCAPPPADKSATAGEMTCGEREFTVRLETAGGTEQRVAGELCVRGELRAQTPVQVLLHGGAYDRRYWDLPYRPEAYSYVRHAVSAGYATLNLDRLGYGRSSRPEGTTLDFTAGAAAIHQVVGQVRGGALGVQVKTVVLNGHSMGGLVAVRAAGMGGADAVIVSGIPPRPGAPGPEGSDNRSVFYPAAQDPKFADKPWAAGYFTTRPGRRPEAFLFPGTFEDAMVPVDEELKDTLTAAELRAVQPAPGERPAPPRANAVAVPVAYVLGRHDTIACRSTDCTTDPRAAGAAYIVPGSGHSINQSHGAADFYRWTFQWLSGLGLS